MSKLSSTRINVVENTHRQPKRTATFRPTSSFKHLMPPGGFQAFQVALQRSVAQAADYLLTQLYHNSPPKQRKRTPQMDERDRVIRDLYTGGIHPNEIATRFGITPERVYQIIKIQNS